MEAPTIPTCKRLLLAIGLLTAPAAALADTGASTGGLSAYLKARVADADGRVEIATENYARVLAVAPDPVVAIRAYREAMEAGDMALATRAAAVMTSAGVAPADAALLPLAEAARKRDAKATSAAIGVLAQGPLVVLAPSLYAWVAHAERRDPAQALAAAGRDPVAGRFATETRARLVSAPPGQPLGIGIADVLAGLAADLVTGEPSPLSIALAQAATRADPDKIGRAHV